MALRKVQEFEGAVSLIPHTAFKTIQPKRGVEAR